ncbi:MAG TPA: 4-hydroxythreonine-4-phosphate dehydrogenase PdxA [Methylibium sp.]|uniref:4-hydroxythreonine-4-phosphate dehydrogenase PdxA n=1 Tax=Methylibium sp. TaxID=2067992 RepID=UPI002DB769B3|nr:4-hydroxythreonine-4-phosphate dehydrogenase PdxA [Methylibium sp.]HEU4459305.1 4-hydroxythreonine-4-phosphate dehydrogenase PdxA [Methylibium sp.]
MNQPPIAITMGDACGIGPELVAMGFERGALPGGFVVGDVGLLRRAASIAGGAAGLPVAVIERPADALEVPPRCVPVLPVATASPAVVDDFVFGRTVKQAGALAADCIRHAVRLARAGEVPAIVTAPLHKEALAAAGVPYPGHTEMLQAEAAEPGSPPPPVRMMLANDQLKTVLVSIHMALRQAIEAVNANSVLETLRIAHAAAARWGQPKPRIAVAGLNPHAGEGGLFGDEEIRHIAPAIEAARAEGIDAHGPFAPDTVFMRARHAPGHPGAFDLVVAMYHDQGLIPVKYLGLDEGVNVTLGLPFVRTSPDHGTAFDLAGSGRADPTSLIAAFAMAKRLAGG